MTSCTSNSEKTAEIASADALISDALTSSTAAPTPWRQVWVIALGVALVGMGSWEFVLRVHDRGPSVRESPADWATRWSQIDANPTGAETLAILGDSRVIFGVRPSILESELGLRPLSLAISASDPLPVLERLCERGFAGRVFVGVRPGSFFTQKCEVHTEGFLDDADQLGPAKLVEASRPTDGRESRQLPPVGEQPSRHRAVYVANGFELEPSELVRDAHGHGPTSPSPRECQGRPAGASDRRNG